MLTSGTQMPCRISNSPIKAISLSLVPGTGAVNWTRDSPMQTPNFFIIRPKIRINCLNALIQHGRTLCFMKPKCTLRWQARCIGRVRRGKDILNLKVRKGKHEYSFFFKSQIKLRTLPLITDWSCRAHCLPLVASLFTWITAPSQNARVYLSCLRPPNHEVNIIIQQANKQSFVCEIKVKRVVRLMGPGY